MKNNQPIPPNLLKALDRMEQEDVMPVMITRELENFLTERGLYQSSMTPTEAWQTLYRHVRGKPNPNTNTESTSPNDQ